MFLESLLKPLLLHCLTSQNFNFGLYNNFILLDNLAVPVWATECFYINGIVDGVDKAYIKKARKQLNQNYEANILYYIITLENCRNFLYFELIYIYIS